MKNDALNQFKAEMEQAGPVPQDYRCAANLIPPPPGAEPVKP